MYDEESVSDLVLERVKPDKFFTYPDYYEETEITEIIRRSCLKANEMRKQLGVYLQIEGILKSDVPPVIVSVLLGGLGNAIEWLFGAIGMMATAIYGALVLSLFFLAFTEGAGRSGVYLWLYSGFPENLLILLGIPLLILYFVGIMISVKNDLEAFVGARKAVTVEKNEWERELKKQAESVDCLYNEIYNMSCIGGIPIGSWQECDRIWGYIKEKRADSLSEALNLLEMDQRTENFGKNRSVLAQRVEIEYSRAGFLLRKTV